jgi:hypothetical protein
MVRITALLPVLVTGCSAVFGLDTPNHAPADATDAPGIVVDGGPDACVSYSTLVDTCTLQYDDFDGDLPIFLQFNTDTKTFSSAVTDVTPRDVQTPTGSAVLIAVRSVHVQMNLGTFQVVGNKPLIVAARDMIVVDGQVNVAAGGAGARACGAGAGANDGGGGGGGAGASFAALGADGGRGDSDGSTPSLGGTTNTVVARPTGPLGGCNGGKGGDSNTKPGGSGGGGGGSIALIASRIEIGGAGQINAGGGGGAGGQEDSGGGGGGSGGFLIFESPMTIIAGRLGANGGGGGEGAGNNPGDAGNTGALQTTRAAGGAGGATNGSDGGSGGAGTTPNGATSPDFLSNGGGGGGGGVGFISISGSPTILTGAVITPPYSVWP